MSMSDRELLEMAAKAAGYDVMRTVSGHLVVDFKKWNPLEDDGDAMRLAVKLSMFIAICPQDETVCVELIENEVTADNFNGDPCAATRRAIVRAAAELGKSMQESK